MGKIVEKFNIFDIFTMLLPGVIISCLYGVSLSFIYNNAWEKWGNAKYVIFIIFAYVLGIALQEIGSFVDKKILRKKIYGEFFCRKVGIRRYLVTKLSTKMH